MEETIHWLFTISMLWANLGKAFRKEDFQSFFCFVPRCVSCKSIDEDLYARFWRTLGDRFRIPWCSGKGAVSVSPDVGVPIILVSTLGSFCLGPKSWFAKCRASVHMKLQHSATAKGATWEPLGANVLVGRGKFTPTARANSFAQDLQWFSGSDLSADLGSALVSDCDMFALVASSHALPLQNVDKEYNQNQVSEASVCWRFQFKNASLRQFAKCMTFNASPHYLHLRLIPHKDAKAKADLRVCKPFDLASMLCEHSN